MINLAINYSRQAAELYQSGQIQLDYFKCPAWEDLITEARAILPTYVHFPLRVGRGMVIDTEKKQEADFDYIEKLLKMTDTPCVNIHLSPFDTDYPEMSYDTLATADIEVVVENSIKAIRQLVARFGADKILVENVPSVKQAHMLCALYPDVITRVIDETSTTLLFDLSHARLSAHRLGMNDYQYIGGLPLKQMQEMHVTGISRVDDTILELLDERGLSNTIFHKLAGELVDHVPFTPLDWDMTAWAFEQIHFGAWRSPWVVAFEYGGVGGVFEALSDTRKIAEQVPRLYRMVKHPHPIHD
jgi:uncharacterized protein (UPF0276 family)